eukprot:scaffold34725_cov36-Phaeocystis_antarctica.AAC.1
MELGESGHFPRTTYPFPPGILPLTQSIKPQKACTCRRAEALEVRYPATAGVGEEAHSRQPHWCPWSKPMNVET